MYTQHEISLNEHHLWFEYAGQDPRKHLLIYEAIHTPLGFVSFTELESSGVAERGYYAAPDAPKGTGRALGRAALDYAFDEITLHKVCGQAIAFNERSIRFHQSFGFEQEGVLRDQHFDGEHHHHVVCFGLLRDEWQSKN
jgi:UDP-4-amino-4,6-dideoxy-N-acetyl-beta-L-altrosamine N-acetyltransferase